MRTVFLAVLLAACGGDSGSSSCTTAQVEVKYFGGSADGKTECQPVPGACGGSASCAASACISALYNLCASPYIGVGCSDTFPPTIVSCNP